MKTGICVFVFRVSVLWSLCLSEAGKGRSRKGKRVRIAALKIPALKIPEFTAVRDEVAVFP